MREYGHRVILTNVFPQVLSVLEGIGTDFEVHRKGTDIERLFKGGFFTVMLIMTKLY